jgi:hypothetical protein
MSKSVLCIVPDSARAEIVVSNLRAAGFMNDDISVLFPDRTGARDFAVAQGTKAPEGALAGATAGGAVGVTVGWIVGIGALAIPGAGPFLAAGPILAALSGAAIGATVGGITGALIGMGVPEFEAKQYEGKLKSGSVLISVGVVDSEETKRARGIFEVHGGESITVTNDASVPGQPATKSLSASSIDR